MTIVKLRINLSEGLIDVEGDEAFVSRVYEDFKDRLGSIELNGDDGRNEDAAEGAQRKARKKKAVAKKGSGAENTGPYKLDIVEGIDDKKLKEFVAPYDPQNLGDNTAIYVYFVKNKSKITCSANHIYTCYRLLKVKPPEAFIQHIRDTRGKRKFISYPSLDDISLTPVGISHVEHDIPKKAKAA